MSKVRLHPDAHEESRVFAIRQDSSGYWWQCSPEHGAGWHRQIRQAWSRREALRAIRPIQEPIDGLSLVRLVPEPTTPS